MSFLSLPPVDQDDEEWRALVESAEQTLGYLPNYLRLYSLHPEAYQAWRGLASSIFGQMDERRYELVTVAAARRIRSSYCSLAHGKILAEKFHTPDEVTGFYRGDDPGPLDDVDRAVVDLADKVAADATSVTRADVERLRDLGLSDRDILDVILAAAARCFFAKVTDAAGVLPDAAFHGLDPELRQTLTVGRPIEPA